jgi:formylglycine-generating enzyme required for sulfatase activity
MVYVPAGEFTMGSLPGEGEGDEMPQHTVFLDAFWIDRTETGGERPTVRLSWNEAQDYCNSVGGRLPTEAEWEKAARGTDGREYPWGNDIPDNTKANYCEEGEDCGIEKRPDGLLVYKEQGPVGLFPAGASPYGALDMAGNVWEWVADWYDPSYYTSSPSENPSGPDNGDNKVLKGGSFNNSAWEIRSANRHSALPKDGDKSIGFRCMVIP